MSLDLLIPLVAGHLLGDFVLQSDEMVRRRVNLAVLLGHGLIVALASWILSGYFAAWWWMVPAVFVTHVAIDVTKDSVGKRFERRDLVVFASDQMAHFVVLVLLTAAATAA